MDGRCCVHKLYNFRECPFAFGSVCGYQCGYGKPLKAHEYGECEREFNIVTYEIYVNSREKRGILTYNDSRYQGANL